MKVPRHLLDIDPLLGIIVLGVVAAAVLPSILNPGEPVQMKWAQADILTKLPEALERYRRDNGAYPTTWQGLEALVQPPVSGPGSGGTWAGPYIDGSSGLADPWGNGYIYVCPGVKNPAAYDLASLGKDARPSKDDIKNW